MPKLTLDAAVDGLKKLGFKLNDEPKFKKHIQEHKELSDMADEPLLIMVMGEFSSGKSTFINAILGQEVTVIGATPTTAVITKICYGDKDETLIHFKDGHTEEYDSNAFMRLTAETEADSESRNLRLSMDYVEKRLNLPILKDVSIIDSPGLGAITAGHEETTKRFMGNADAVVWLMSALQPAKATEINALEALDPRFKPILLMNKIDEIDEEEDDLEDILDDARQKVKNYVRSVHGISAKKALNGRLNGNSSDLKDSNIDEFFNLLQNEVLPHKNEYRMRTMVHETATLLRHTGETLKFWNNEISPLQNTNYDRYVEEKAKLQSVEQELAEFARLWKDYVYDKGEEAERNYFEGVLYQYGFLAPTNATRALECFKIAAKYGESEAETAYAAALEKFGAKYGESEAETVYAAALEKFGNYNEAFNEYQKAALQENGEAAAGLARLIEKGCGNGDSQEWYKKAALWGFKEAHLFINYGSNVIARFKGLKEAAERGIPQACVELAKCYEQGAGCVRDLRDAFKWRLEAALQGLRSQFIPVAESYRDGVGIPKNSEQEFYWYTRAADYGDKDSQLNIALYLFNGHGVSRDIVESFIRLKQLADNASTYFVSSKAKEYIKELFEQGSINIQLLIGDAIYDEKLHKLYRANNLYEAVKWYERAEHQDSMDGAYKRGVCLWRIYHEKERNLEYLYNSYIAIKKAAEQGHNEAAKFLKDNFENATAEGYFALAQAIEENSNDDKAAFLWYEKSATGGYPHAFTVLGEHYAIGKGCAQSWFSAYSWLSKANKADGERGKTAYNEFMRPAYKKLKRTISIAAVVILTLGLYVYHEEILAQPTIYKRIYGNRLSELAIGQLQLGDSFNKMHSILGNETGKKQQGYFQVYEYPNISVYCRNDKIEALVAKNSTVATKRGLRNGMTYDDMIEIYGSPKLETESNGVKLYEYKFNGFDSRYGLLQVAVNPATQLVEIISVRIPAEETYRVAKEAEERRIAKEKRENEKKETKNNINKESFKKNPLLAERSPSDDMLGGVKLGDRIEHVEEVLGNPIKKTVKGENVLRNEYNRMEIAYDNGNVIGIVTDDEDVIFTGRGIRTGTYLHVILRNYGKNYTLSTYNDLDLYEYTFNGSDRPYILRFAIRKGDERVKYISLRYAD